MKKQIFIALLIVSYMLIVYINAHAKVSGPCVNCHTMRNSQNGTAVTSGGPYTVLLVNDCLGCHSATGADTWQDSVTGAPIVYNINDAPTYGVGNHGLAGGNFYWVRTDDTNHTNDTKGHNIFSDNPDDNLTVAPGDPGRLGCGGTNSCHSNISGTITWTIDRQGCTKCHMMNDAGKTSGFHHADDDNTVVGSDIDDTDGFYRFLTGHVAGIGHGVSGIEDTDWQKTYGASDHNEYLGNETALGSNVAFSALGHTMTGFCCGCHGNFHVQQTGGAWIRHPSDAVIPNSGEYSAYTTYDPQVPVARPDLSDWTEPSSTITLAQDMVMCLSCHRPHGSPYPDMLRWDYSTMVAGEGGSGGCFTCHSQKNQAP